MDTLQGLGEDNGAIIMVEMPARPVMIEVMNASGGVFDFKNFTHIPP